MLLRSVSPQHFGPFSVPTKIEIEQDVTVLTGPNDSGKSYALEAIKMLCRRSKCEEQHVNMDRVGSHAGAWSEDPEVLIAANVQITEASAGNRNVRGAVQPGDFIRFKYLLNRPGQGYEIIETKRGKGKLQLNGVSIKKLPKVIDFQTEASIRNVIDLANITPAEDHLLKLGFGREFVPAVIQPLSSDSRAIHLERARNSLNKKLRRFFPKEMSHEFRLIDIAGEGKLIGVSLVDGAGGFSPIEYRGTGIRRLLSLMGTLLQEIDPDEDTILLLDEPETSLHADAQHQLRRVLEELGKNPKIQVVYATHSPSMVNPAHPERIRVFSRHQHGDIASTTVETPKYGDNFQKVRTSLGLTPSDSLLYGLVTILVEGDTEARCLGPLLRKLDEENASGFDGLAKLLESSHFVCGAGDSISYYCKLSADQNAHPVVFLDGDKNRMANKIREERPGVPVIVLPEGTEFENIVPQSRYISALAECLQQHTDAARIKNDAFDEWISHSKLPAQMMFSKKIDRWVESVTGGSYNKHAVMEVAIRQTPADEIEADSLRELAQIIRAQVA